jgi:hypothetical protein
MKITSKQIDGAISLITALTAGGGSVSAGIRLNSQRDMLNF